MLGVYRSTLLTIELMYCKIYLGMVDADPLWIHLNEAAKFYDDDCFRLQQSIITFLGRDIII